MEIIIVSIYIIVSMNRSTMEYGGHHLTRIKDCMCIFDSFSITSQNKITKESKDKITAELTYIRVKKLKSRLQTKRLIKKWLDKHFCIQLNYREMSFKIEQEMPTIVKLWQTDRSNLVL